jgi:hypothetical protein
MTAGVQTLGACAAEGIEAKRVGKEPNLAPLLRTVAVATAGKTGTKWDFSPRVAADVVLPRRPLGLLIAHFQARMHPGIGMPLRSHPFAGLARLPLAAGGHRLRTDSAIP